MNFQEIDKYIEFFKSKKFKFIIGLISFLTIGTIGFISFMFPESEGGDGEGDGGNNTLPGTGLVDMEGATFDINAVLLDSLIILLGSILVIVIISITYKLLTKKDKVSIKLLGGEDHENQ